MRERMDGKDGADGNLPLRGSSKLPCPDSSRVCLFSWPHHCPQLSAFCFHYHSFKPQTPLRRKQKSSPGEQRKSGLFEACLWRPFVNFTNPVLNKCERIFFKEETCFCNLLEVSPCVPEKQPPHYSPGRHAGQRGRRIGE